MTPRRHLVAVVVFAICATTACGGDDARTTSDATATTVGSVAPTSNPPAVTNGVADMTTVPVPPVADFVRAAGLPQLEGPATIWAWPADAAVTPDEVVALAGVFGVDGSVAEQPAAEGGGYTVGSYPRQLWVRGDAQATWSFLDAFTEVCDADPVHTTAPAVDSPAAVPCTPARGMPSAEAAETVARDLLVDLGLDPDDHSIATTVQDDSVWIEAALVVDGVPTQVTTKFAVGDGAEVRYASGQLRPPQPVADTTLIGTDAAFARLQSGFLLRAYSPVPEEPEVTAPAVTAVPTDPAVVTIVQVEPDWWTDWSEDGTVTLYPAYAFVSDEGERLTIPAVPDAELPPWLR